MVQKGNMVGEGFADVGGVETESGNIHKKIDLRMLLQHGFPGREQGDIKALEIGSFCGKIAVAWKGNGYEPKRREIILVFPGSDEVQDGREPGTRSEKSDTKFKVFSFPKTEVVMGNTGWFHCISHVQSSRSRDVDSGVMT
jgi:hypothetical protein